MSDVGDARHPASPIQLSSAELAVVTSVTLALSIAAAPLIRVGATSTPEPLCETTSSVRVWSSLAPVLSATGPLFLGSVGVMKAWVTAADLISCGMNMASFGMIASIVTPAAVILGPPARSPLCNRADALRPSLSDPRMTR